MRRSTSTDAASTPSTTRSKVCSFVAFTCLLVLCVQRYRLVRFDAGRVFTKADLDRACEQLATVSNPNASAVMSWAWNPHRAPLGLGNYDVNALMFVLEEKGEASGR